MILSPVLKVCDKHQLYLNQNVTYEDQGLMLSEYNEKLDVASYQEKIEYRKNNCQICYFGAIGKNMLLKIVKNKNKTKPILL